MDYITPDLASILLTISCLIGVSLIFYCRGEALVSMVVGIIWITSAMLMMTFIERVNKPSNTAMSNYVDSIKTASYNSVQDGNVQINSSIAAQISTTEIGTGQKRVNIIFSKESQEFKKETVFKIHYE